MQLSKHPNIFMGWEREQQQAFILCSKDAKAAEIEKKAELEAKTSLI